MPSRCKEQAKPQCEAVHLLPFQLLSVPLPCESSEESQKKTVAVVSRNPKDYKPNVVNDITTVCQQVITLHSDKHLFSIL